MSLSIIREDITRLAVDAIVDPTDEYYSGSGGTDAAIHRAAGPMLRLALARKKPLRVGEATITSGFFLPAKYIIHTCGPIWGGGEDGEDEELAQCYESCLALAKEYGCRSVAFPLISGGTFGFPNDDALRIAKDTISEFLRDNGMEVTIVTYQLHTYNLSAKLFADVARFVDDNYYEIDLESEGLFASNAESEFVEAPAPCTATSIEPKEPVYFEKSYDLEEMLSNKSETFSCMLFRLVKDSGKKAPEIYNEAKVAKSVYSKIMGNIHYKPSKLTAVAFGLALHLSWEELRALVESAGYSMTHTNKFDIVIEYFVRKKNYDIDEINGVLYDLDPELPLIGC